MIYFAFFVIFAVAYLSSAAALQLLWLSAFLNPDPNNNTTSNNKKKKKNRNNTNTNNACIWKNCKLPVFQCCLLLNRYCSLSVALIHACRCADQY